MTSWRSLFLAVCLFASVGNAAASFAPSGSYHSTNALGHSSTSSYNAAGDLTEETSPLGLVTRHSYNARGEKTQTTHPDGTVETWDYDAEGQEVKHCQAGLCEETVYDLLGRATETKDAAGNSSKTAYDAAGQVTATTDELGRTSR